MSSNASDHERIVITGAGLISSLGCDLDVLREDAAVFRPKNARAPSRVAQFRGDVDEFQPVSPQAKRTIRKSLKLMNRETQMGVAAASRAVNDSSLLGAGYEPDRIGVCFGAGNVEINPADFVDGVESCLQHDAEAIEALWPQVGIGAVEPLWILRVLPNMPACHIAIICDLQGPNNTITQREVSANQAMDEARHYLLDDEADAMVVGSCGTAIRSQSIGTNSDGNGVHSASEGAGAFVLERLDAARERGAKIYGELLSTSSSCSVDGTRNGKPRDAIQLALAKLSRTESVAKSQPFCVAADSLCEQQPVSKGSNLTVPMINLSQLIGDVDAASGAIGLAAALTRLRAESKPVAISINATPSGLASCVAVRHIHHAKAA